MKLLPFGSYAIGPNKPDGSRCEGYQQIIQCPMCLWLHQNGQVPDAKFCTDTHLDELPHVNATTAGDAPVPHLHRNCLHCKYEWTAQEEAK